VRLLARYCGRLEKSVFYIMYTGNFNELPMYTYTESTLGKAEHGGSSAVLLFIL
jgi:hypothetical protein